MPVMAPVLLEHHACTRGQETLPAAATAGSSTGQPLVEPLQPFDGMTNESQLYGASKFGGSPGWKSLPDPTVQYPCCLKYCGSEVWQPAAPQYATSFSRKWSMKDHAFVRSGRRPVRNELRDGPQNEYCT